MQVQARTLGQAGFKQLRAVGMVKGRRYEVPIGVVGSVEAALDTLPSALRRRAIHIDVLYRLSQVVVVGRKYSIGEASSGR